MKFQILIDGIWETVPVTLAKCIWQHMEQVHREGMYVTPTVIRFAQQRCYKHKRPNTLPEDAAHELSCRVMYICAGASATCYQNPQHKTDVRIIE